MANGVKLLFVFLFLSFNIYAQYYNYQPSELTSLSLEELLNIRITTASKKNEPVNEIPASVIVITRDEIEKYGYTTLQEVFENIPGLFIIDDYTSQGPSLGIRGFWDGLFNRNVKIMINGVQQTYDYTNTKNFPKISLPVESIERIEFVRGPMAIFYGSGAFYGAINILTNAQSKDDESGIIAARVGSNEYAEGIIRYSGNLGEDDLRFTADLSYFKSGGPDHPFSKFRSVEYPSGWGASADQNLSESSDNDQYAFSLSGHYKNLDINFRHVNYTDHGHFLFPVYEGGEGTYNNNSSTNIYTNYHVPFSDNVYSEIKLGYYTEKQRTFFDFFNEDFYGQQYDGASSIDGEINLFYNPNEDVKTTFGVYHHAIVDFYKTFDLPSFLNPSLENNSEYIEDGSINSYAFFSQIEYKISSRINLIGGLRLERLGDYSFGIDQIRIKDEIVDNVERLIPVQTNLKGKYDGGDWEVIPRAALIYSVTKNTVVKLLFGKAINHPSLFQNIKNIGIPDNELKAEKLTTLEFNLISNQIDNLYFSLSGYRNELDNLITRVISVSDDGTSYSTFNANAGTMVTLGMDVTIRGVFNDEMGFELSGTFQKTEDKLQGMEDIKPAYSPDILAYLKAYYNFTENISLSATANYVDRMETYWDDRPMNIAQNILEPIGRIGMGSSSYINVGANLRINDFLKKGLYLNVKCSNLFDDDIHYPTFTNNTWADIGTFGYGRRIFLTVGYKF